MHELAIAKNIMDIVQEHIPAQGDTVTIVRLTLGKMSGVVPEALQFCFENMIPGTPLEGAKLAIEEVPARAFCMECQREFEIETVSFLCPFCNSPSIKLLSGREMLVNSIEIEEK
ncbi:hydrogenase maturation nickel metallochaperone HypA [bacterium]|nr:hydrogenase maturation nickel metallochaperone HypA [bacterium]